MNTEINKSSNNTNNKLLLPPKTSQKKTLVLDLDETLVHSQFNTFSSPSDVTIKIEVDNEIHDIHVMVRPGVKEFLQDMEKIFEIVIFTASVSKYADPLLDIIDKNGYCPFRLFREHCSLINTTFVKDLERLGRDLKDIIIVDNSPLSYSLHPDNGLPILTWFEDKNDTELFKLKPVLEFLSYVPDVRDFIPKFIGENNKINYEKTKEIINGYKGPKYIVQDKENENKNNNKKNLKINPKEIHVNIEIVDKNSNNNALRKRNNKNKTNEKKNNKNNYKKYHDKLATLDIKSIITNVSPDSIIQNINNNQNLLNKKKINYKKKLENKNNDKKLNNEKFIKINLNNFINIKKSNNNSYSPKNKIYKKSKSEKKFKILQNKRISNSAGANRIKKSLNKINTNNKKIYIYINKNNNNKNQFKLNNQTPKMNKTINLVSNNLYTTRSDKCNQKTNNYIKEKNYIRNNISLYDKISKSDYKNTLNIEKAIKKDNTIYNKIKHNNTIYKTFNKNIN